MRTIGLASVAAMALTAVASADNWSDSLINVGEARLMGIISGAQLAAIQRLSDRRSNLYSTNWTNDSNGATFTSGNIASAVGALGQGGWAYYCSGGNGTAATNYKINAGSPTGRTGQKLQITGANSTSQSRYVYQDVSAQWAARNAGDNIAWVEYDAYMSSASNTSGNRTGGFLYGQGSSGTAGGMLTGMACEYGTSGTTTKQGSVFGYAYYTNGTTTGNFRFKLSDQALGSGGTSPLAVSGGWTKFAMSWNKTSGQVNWYYSVDEGATYTGFYVNGAAAAAGYDVAEWDFYARQATGTTTANAVFGDFGTFASANCSGDLDRNGVVDTADIALLLLDFGPCAGCPSDLDGSGTTDTADVSLLLLDFGACP